MNRSRTLRTCITLLASLSLAACSWEAIIRRFTPPEVDARSRAYLAQIARGQADSAEARLAPAVAGADAHAQFQQIESVLRGTRFDSLHVVGAQVNTVNGVRHTELNYEFKGSRGLVRATVATVDEGGEWYVEGLSASTADQPVEQENPFDLAGKSALHYLWLLLTVLAALASLGTAIFIATRRGMPRRWPWALAALLGLGEFGLNWSDGTIRFDLLNVQILCASAGTHGPDTPWMLAFSLPLGAFLAARRYRAWRGQQDAAAEAAHATVAGGPIDTAEPPIAEPPSE